MISESMAICLGLLVRAYLPYFLNIYIFKQGSFQVVIVDHQKENYFEQENSLFFRKTMLLFYLLF